MKPYRIATHTRQSNKRTVRTIFPDKGRAQVERLGPAGVLAKFLSIRQI